MKQKSVAVIEDISCFGRCSLTVALPLISALGVKTSVIPTAVLSTHTGGFRGNTFRDLTEDIMPISEHWKKEGLKFDAIYTGYLCSDTQIDAVINAVDNIRSDGTFVIVDPAMGDNGKLYGSLSRDLPQKMLQLCQKADIIVPNVTEACMLSERKYTESGYSEKFIDDLLMCLCEKTNATAVLTGVSFNPEEIGAAVLENGKVFYSFSKKTEGSFHGTGDVFASILTGNLVNGNDLASSVKAAVSFTELCVKKTAGSFTDKRFGLNFEECIPDLFRPTAK